MTFTLVLLLGFAVGLVEALLLRRAARRGPSPFGALARLLLVGGVLLAAALAGQLAAGAIGWIVGLGGGVVTLARRWS